MKLNRRQLLALMGASATAPLAWAEAPYMLGVEYKKVPKPHPQKKLVSEFFFYGCPHCYHLEPSIEAWLKTKPKDVTFERVPAVLNSPSWIFFAKAFYTAKNLGVLEQSHPALFKALYDERLQLFSAEKLAAWYTQFGVAPDKYVAMFNSFKVQTQVQEVKKRTEDMGIDGVPAIVVNGTWLTDVGMAGSRANLWKVVNWLVTQ